MAHGKCEIIICGMKESKEGKKVKREEETKRRKEKSKGGRERRKTLKATWFVHGCLGRTIHDTDRTCPFSMTFK